MAVGQALSDRKPIQPPTAPPKEGVMTGMGQTKSEGKFMQLLSNPAVQAFLVNGGLSMLASGNFGKGISDGAAAVGRYGASKATREKEERDYQLEERRVAAYEKSLDARASGGGGSGGGSGGSGGGNESAIGSMKPKDLAKLLKDAQDAKAEGDATGEFQGLSPIQIQILADRAVAAQANGMSPQRLLEAFDSNPEAARAYVDMWLNAPEEAAGLDAEYDKNVVGAQAQAQGAPATIQTEVAPPAAPVAPPAPIFQPPALPGLPPAPMAPTNLPPIFQPTPAAGTPGGPAVPQMGVMDILKKSLGF